MPRGAPPPESLIPPVLTTCLSGLTASVTAAMAGINRSKSRSAVQRKLNRFISIARASAAIGCARTNAPRIAMDQRRNGTKRCNLNIRTAPAKPADHTGVTKFNALAPGVAARDARLA